jgi:hypothetical protein
MTPGLPPPTDWLASCNQKRATASACARQLPAKVPLAHDGAASSVIAAENPASKRYCVACHKGAERGIYEDDEGEDR